MTVKRMFASTSQKPTWKTFKFALERKYWTELYIECNGNMSLVARISDTNRTHAYKVMQRLGVGPVVKKYNSKWDEPLLPYSDVPTTAKRPAAHLKIPKLELIRAIQKAK